MRLRLGSLAAPPTPPTSWALTPPRGINQVAPLNGFRPVYSYGPQKQGLEQLFLPTCGESSFLRRLCCGYKCQKVKQVRFSDHAIVRQFLPQTGESMPHHSQREKLRLPRLLNRLKACKMGEREEQEKSLQSLLVDNTIWYLDADYSLSMLTGLYPEEIVAIQAIHQHNACRHLSASPILEVTEENLTSTMTSFVEIADTSDSETTLNQMTPYSPSKLGLKIWSELNAADQTPMEELSDIESDNISDTLNSKSCDIRFIGDCLDDEEEEEEELPFCSSGGIEEARGWNPSESSRCGNLLEDLLSLAESPEERHIAKSLERLCPPKWVLNGIAVQSRVHSMETTDWTESDAKTNPPLPNLPRFKLLFSDKHNQHHHVKARN
ncbi:hypothetical protein Ciccas_005963 [Cichlidogyrus casuarinus]|uniref:Uncharacterized protein n=1 Tax=Cichlidogyrus casuarinus TaxID=1844966 RepID=A0ABD2Q763_9PLAT